MSGLYLKYEKVNVLCIADRNHKKSVVELDHVRNFKDI